MVCLNPLNGTADPNYLISKSNSWNFTNKVHLCVSSATTAHYRLSGSRWKSENRLILFQYRPGNSKQTKPRQRRGPNCEADKVYVNQFSLKIVKIKNHLVSSTTGGLKKYYIRSTTTQVGTLKIASHLLLSRRVLKNGTISNTSHGQTCTHA